MFKRSISMKVNLLLILLALSLLSAATVAQIDNCCSIDRQCATDEEWTAGYYAFQNGECPAPSQQPQSQPVVRQSAPAQIDNCCFNGWQCGADDEWISGYWAFQHDHCFSRSHWEDQMTKRETAAESNKRQPAEDQTGNSNRRTQLTSYEITYNPNDPDVPGELPDGTTIRIVPITLEQFCDWFPDEPIC